MKKHILKIIVGICCVFMMIMIAALAAENKYSRKLEVDLLNCAKCNEYQNSMSNYIMEHYDDILNFSEKVLQDYDMVTYKDKFGKRQMENDMYEELLSEYNMDYFNCDEGYIEFYENKICFIYNEAEFENGCYACFYFAFEDDKITTYPYVYELLNKHGY